ncbi:hypothetical protein SAMN04488128_10470 [Chitinophaga eiseniae]|uniref:Uncharacterized protein n=1 Tax=Chitinophaga eiseniae TaxID=634771 RepID=A0A1T4T6Z5_9BACT|nr:hypothetical protein SAMN04488128_10470 [Chitinophaga eiseniae]
MCGEGRLKIKKLGKRFSKDMRLFEKIYEQGKDLDWLLVEKNGYGAFRVRMSSKLVPVN